MSEESEYVTVATLGQVPRGHVVCVDCNGTPVSLANVDGSIYAFAAYCTHQLALLEEAIWMAPQSTAHGTQEASTS